mgnify:FL=1
MEEKFIAAWLAARQQAQALGIRLRPVEKEDMLASAHRQLTGNRCSEGFGLLETKGRLDLSLEALAVDKRFTGLFSDEEANQALTRLLETGYFR